MKMEGGGGKHWASVRYWGDDFGPQVYETSCLERGGGGGQTANAQIFHLENYERGWHLELKSNILKIGTN